MEPLTVPSRITSALGENKMKLFLYLPKEIAKKALAGRQTFALTNLSYYRSIEEVDGIGDKQDGSPVFENGGKGINGRSHLISCWSKADDDTCPDWTLFSDREVAIQSDVESIKSYISTFCVFEDWIKEDSSIQYYDSLNSEEDWANPFLKRSKYKHQNEYRFALSRCTFYNIEQIVLANPKSPNLPAYVHNVFVRPGCLDKQLEAIERRFKTK